MTEGALDYAGQPREGALRVSDEPEETIEVQPLPLDAWHREQGARMVEFAGYHMPIQYTGPHGGIIAEHLWTREHAGLFDVSHMGQLMVEGKGAVEALEAIMPGDFAALKPGRIRYSLLLDENGGILDDLMVTNVTHSESDVPQFYVVVNGACKWDDIAFLREHLPDAVALNHMEDRALLALQGPEAAQALEKLVPGAADELKFMQGTSVEWQGVQLGIGRSGYTGEDGFELSVPADKAEALTDALVAMDEVRPVGLGARDSLRLEAGLPLYGHDLTPDSEPVSAGLTFAISKRRRSEGGFHGADGILQLLADGTETKRIGLKLEGRRAAREGDAIMAGDVRIGTVTSGGFAPSLGHPIAMGYVAGDHAAPDTALEIDVRGKRLAATVVPMPFVPNRYFR